MGDVVTLVEKAEEAIKAEEAEEMTRKMMTGALRLLRMLGTLHMLRSSGWEVKAPGWAPVPLGQGSYQGFCSRNANPPPWPASLPQPSLTSMTS